MGYWMFVSAIIAMYNGYNARIAGTSRAVQVRGRVKRCRAISGRRLRGRGLLCCGDVLNRMPPSVVVGVHVHVHGDAYGHVDAFVHVDVDVGVDMDMNSLALTCACFPRSSRGM